MCTQRPSGRPQTLQRVDDQLLQHGQLVGDLGERLGLGLVERLTLKELACPGHDFGEGTRIAGLPLRRPTSIHAARHQLVQSRDRQPAGLGRHAQAKLVLGAKGLLCVEPGPLDDL